MHCNIVPQKNQQLSLKKIWWFKKKCLPLQSLIVMLSQGCDTQGCDTSKYKGLLTKQTEDLCV